MKRRITFILTSCLFLVMISFTGSQEFKFRNSNLSFDERITDLLSRMTIPEKIGQMMNTAPAIERLGIPAYDWWNEGLHGVARSPYHATSYPQAIAMAATWDAESLQKMGDYTATEGRAIFADATKKGKVSRYCGLTYWTPNINIFRDPRWGRGQETYGEDPFLTGAMGKAFVKGLQGDDPVYLKASACAKHFAVHSGPESSRHTFNAVISKYDLYDTYLPAFHELIVDAKVSGVMCAYNAYAGQPCCGSDILMNKILRNEWGFTGYVTSDCGAITDFFSNHKTSPNAQSASADAVLHGTDVECGSSYKALQAAYNEGLITEAQIDISLRRLFNIRFRLGMFDPPEKVPFANIPMSELESPAHQEHALKMARQSIVLLKNEKRTLPLRKSLKKIAVVGPNADEKQVLLSNYFGNPSKITTVLEGIKAKLPESTQVIYERGTNLTDTNIKSSGGTVEAVDPKAVAGRVKDADAIIFVGGISASLEGEEMQIAIEGFKGGDRTSISLPKVQTNLLKELKATGKPVVFVMMTGSAMAIEWEAENIPAILNVWYGGQAAGTAIADVLFGDYNPAGRLPVTFYRSINDLPDFENYNMDNRTYRYFSGKPLYTFGFGLSYTTFKYENIEVPASASTKGDLPVKVKVKNTGKMDGDEVVQIYITHRNISQKVPIRELKGFKRIALKSGESKVIDFTLSPDAFSLVDENGIRSVGPGEIEISAGGGQTSELAASQGSVLRKVITVTGEKIIISN